MGWLWPYLADYPRRKVAVIDAQCAMKLGYPRTSPVLFQQKQQLRMDTANSQVGRLPYFSHSRKGLLFLVLVWGMGVGFRALV